jgi:hypothetical protein
MSRLSGKVYMNAAGNSYRIQAGEDIEHGDTTFADAVAQIAEEYGDDAFFDEDFGSRVLTIPVCIDPELPLVPVVWWEVGEYRCDRERWR